MFHASWCTERTAVSPTESRRQLVEKVLWLCVSGWGHIIFGTEARRAILKRYITPRKLRKEWVHPEVCSAFWTSWVWPQCSKNWGQISGRNLETRAICPQRCVGNVFEKVHKPKRKGQGYIPVAFGSLESTSTFFNGPQGKNICGRLGTFNAHAEQEDLNSAELDTIQKPYNGHYSQRSSANERGSDRVGLRSWFIRDSTNPRRRSPIAWKTLRRSLIYLWVARNHTLLKMEEHPMQHWKLCTDRCPRAINRFFHFDCKYISNIGLFVKFSNNVTSKYQQSSTGRWVARFHRNHI